MSEYFDELCRAMNMLAEDPRTIFMGQAVACDGTAMRKTLLNVPQEKLLEMPVVEDMQMGMATGMALGGFLPICIYPRINFLLLAVNQLVLHLDKLSLMSGGGYKPRVLIRTAVATSMPLDPGPQHLGDFTASIASMLRTINVVRLEDAAQITSAYRDAMERNGSTLLVESMAEY